MFLRATVVTGETPTGWVSGIGLRPNATQPPSTPSATTTNVRAVSTSFDTVCTPSSTLGPTDGVSQCCIPPPKISR